MAARSRLEQTEDTRKRIQTTQLIKRLVGHVLGKIDLSPSQVTAALGLIKKSLPDLQSIEMDVSGEVTQKVVSAEPLSEQEWAAQHSTSDTPVLAKPH